ncbi:unnamed protein product [Amoebophrya sp. A25]|nr:unnamed protein product [Amoebophrya sp. A25]|eukprot:GSA25T00023604001.1
MILGIQESILILSACFTTLIKYHRPHGLLQKRDIILLLVVDQFPPLLVVDKNYTWINLNASFTITKSKSFGLPGYSPKFHCLCISAYRISWLIIHWFFFALLLRLFVRFK